MESDFVEKTRRMVAEFGVEIPPKVFVEMGAEITDYVRNQSMTVSMPAPERYAGPTGMLQGGIIAAAFDNAFGPFAYLTAKRPCVTTDLHITYLRPIKTGSGKITVEVTLRAKTRRFVFMDGVVYNGAGKPAAKAAMTVAILTDNARGNPAAD